MFSSEGVVVMAVCCVAKLIRANVHKFESEGSLKISNCLRIIGSMFLLSRAQVASKYIAFSARASARIRGVGAKC